MSSFILYFHFQELVFEYSLPAGNDRRVRMNLGRAVGLGDCDLDFEVWNHTWHVLSGDAATFSIGGIRLDDHVLGDGDVVNGLINRSGVAFTFIVHALDESQARFEKFSLTGRPSLIIGSDSQADIVIKDPYASKKHATLVRSGGDTVLTDFSRNGTYLNNRRIMESDTLQMMDVIYIMGVKLVYMGDFLAVNQPGIRDTSLQNYRITNTRSESPAEDLPLIRSPRLVEPLDTEDVELEAPPNPQRQKRAPLIFAIGPAVTMPLPIVASVLMNSAQGTGSGFYMGTIVSVVLSALIGTMWAVAHQIYNKRSAAAEEKHRVAAYTQYIDKNEKLLQDKHKRNTGVLSSQHLSLQEFSSVLAHNTSVLWNRNVNQQDFLMMRLGLGSIGFQGNILAPKQRFSLVADPLESEARNLAEKYRNIPQAVSLLHLGEVKIAGVLGGRDTTLALARVIAMQTAALHCYTDVKMVFLIKPEEEGSFSWAKMLPHARSQDNKLRLICARETERQNVIFHLNGILRTRMEEQADNDKKTNKMLPHYVVFCTHPDLVVRESIYQYMVDDGCYGVTFVLLYGMLDKLPNECTHILQNDNEFSGYYRMDQARDETNLVRFDQFSAAQAEVLSRRIGGYVINEIASGEIPSAISFLEMYGISDVKQWDLQKRWQENRAYESLRALMGIGSGGKPLYLDIHEKQHGPHGLMAGTTGSGKSETIQTYILSLVMNFHPHEIALVLIDYKGGGMAQVFLDHDLPHLAGTITNLDGNQTNRALASIRAEIKRRQSYFNAKSVNHIDQYARLFREGEATEPLPHLIIISDEFAELKKEQPEFIKELVSTARVGRSLGVHLILATQKPSGVVDDEIWSNSRFKICLRVQDKQDSNEMLKRPDAAYLTNIGRAYMQIGNDEIFEMFQSGYSGAYYEPDALLSASRDSEVSMIGLDGAPLLVKSKKRSDGEKQITQLAACVRFIRQEADSIGVENTRKLWLPELQEGVSLRRIKSEFKVPAGDGLYALYGLLDDPSNQRQEGVAIDFYQTGNLLVAGVPGIGKSTLLQTMLYSLATFYPPERVIFYCLDFSSTLMKVFAGLPHCGGVVGADDGERISRLFGLMKEMTEERARLFESASVGGFDEYRRLEGEPLPAVLLVLDNYFAFAERYPELEDEFAALSRRGAKFGVHLVVSVSHLGDMKYKLRQSFTETLPLLLSERSDYMEVLGVMPEYMPPNRKGRGILGTDALEFQTALAVEGDNERERAENMRREFAALPASGYSAPVIRFIPKTQSYGEFLESGPVRDEMGSGQYLCIGYDVADISIAKLSLKDTYCYSVSASTPKAAENMLLNLVEAGRALDAQLHLVCLRDSALNGEEYDGVYRGGDDVFALLVRLKEEFTRRSALRKQALQADVRADVLSQIKEEFGLLFIFIDSMNSFIETVYEKQQEDFSPIVEMFFKQGKGLGVYFVAGFDSSIYSANIYKPACKSFIDYRAGIHLGGKLDQQKLFDVSMPMSEQMKAREPNSGYTVEDNQPRGIFVPSHRV